MKVLEFVKDAGLSQRALGKHLGYSKSWFFHLQNSKTPRQMNQLSDCLVSRGKLLSEFSFRKHNLEEILDATGWKLTGLASRLGCSRQWIYRVLREDLLTEERAELIEREVRKFGQEMIEQGLSLLATKKAA